MERSFSCASMPLCRDGFLKPLDLREVTGFMQLAYLMARTVNDDSWSGGLLITDERGLPLDFRYIEPIHPSHLQRLIYGGALRRYLILDAIAGTLLKAANTKIDWVFTTDTFILEIDGQCGGKFVAIEQSKEHPFNFTGEWKKEAPGEILMQTASTGNPVQLTFIAKDDSETDKIAIKLSNMTHEFDFTEPLTRVGEALDEICQPGRV
jgi:hypothetical protein